MYRNIINTAILCVMVIVSSKAAAAHKSVFTWRIRGDANYQQWIYDGENPIAMFDMSTLDEPMQALMMFSAVPRPILLKHLKLTPGGSPLVQAVQLYWKSGIVITDVLDGLTVKGEGTDHLTVVFTVKDRWDTVAVTRTLTLSYDDVTGSYIYDFMDRAVIHCPETLHTNSTVRIEYCDPWFVDCPAPSQKFPGMWKGRYTKFAFEAPDNRILAAPHNHITHPPKEGIAVKEDGMFVAVYEPDGNPAIQIMGDTSKKTSFSICPWGYDVHMSLAVAPSELYKPLTTHFRILQCPDAKAREMDRNAIISPEGRKVLPMYEPVSSFEKELSSEKPRQSEVDPWFWRPQGETGAVWDMRSGHTGSRSLKIEKDTSGIASWYSMCEGQGYFTAPWTPCKGYEISCWVKTQDVMGQGASIGVKYHVPNIPPRWPITCSRRISGTNGWTKLIVRIGYPPEDTSIVSLHLQQAGKGTTWFDDLEVKMLR